MARRFFTTCSSIQAGSGGFQSRGGQPVGITGPRSTPRFGFAVTSEGIYYGAPPHAGEERYIRFFRFADGNDSPGGPVKRRFHAGIFHSGIDASPDRRFLIVDQYDDSGSDLMLVEEFRAHRKGPLRPVYKLNLGDDTAGCPRVLWSTAIADRTSAPSCERGGKQKLLPHAAHVSGIG
jgi:hypothetical protein